MAEATEEFTPIYRIKRCRFWIGLHEKTIWVEIYIKDLRQLLVVIRFNSSAEDDTINWKGDRIIHGRIKEGDLKASPLKRNLRFILQIISDKDHTLPSCVVVIGFIKSVGPHIAVEHIDIHTWIF